MWDAIKSRFGGYDESKKMQKYILKQQIEGFSISNLEGLHKGYDRFKSLLSQLEIHGAGVSTEDANKKFLRSLLSAWSQVSLIMRTKPGVDSLSFDDRYNNRRVFENDVKGSTASSSSTQNVAFVSENTSNTNDVSTAYSVSNTSEQLDEFDIEEMDLIWQVAMVLMRMKKFYKKFYKKTGRKLQFDAKEPVGFDKTKVECYNCHKTSHFARECRTKENQDSRRRDAWNSGNKDGRRSGKQKDSKAFVTIDGEGVDWTSHSEEKEDYALMACNNSGLDTERMAKQAELNNSMRMKSSQREIRPIWNNVQRVNHKNQFVPTAVLTRTGKIPVNTARASGTNNVSTARHDFNRQAVPTNAAMKVNTVKPIVNRVNTAEVNAVSAVGGKRETACHMTGKRPTLMPYQDFIGGPVAFEEVKGYILVKKNKVLFTDSECLVLSPEFKLPDENKVLLRISRKNNLYSFNLENIVPSGGLACLIAKATIDESNKWHRRLGHVNFKNLNKLVKGNLVRGLPSKIFKNDHTCVACQKGKQHKASCKAKSVSSISHCLQLLHMDLFGPTSKEDESAQDYFVLPIWSSYSSTVKRSIEKNVVADFTNLEPVVNVSPIPTSRINSIHPSTLILGDPQSAVQTRKVKVTKSSGAILLICLMGRRQLEQNCYRNKKDERGVVVINKARLVAQGHRQEEGIDYDEEVYVSQPPGFIDPKYPQKVYKVVKALYGLHQDSRADMLPLSTLLVEEWIREELLTRSSSLRKKHDIILVQVYVDDIIFVLQICACSRNSDSAGANLDRKTKTGLSISLQEDLFVGLQKADNCGYFLRRQNMLLLQIAEGKHHFIRDAYEKKPIQVLKIHTDDNVADLLTKAFNCAEAFLTISDEFQEVNWVFKSHWEEIKTSDPSPRPSHTPHIPDFIPEVSGGNHGGQSSSDKSLLGNEGDMTLQSVNDLCISLCTQVTDQAKEIKHLKAQIKKLKKLKKQAKHVITHHKAWMKSGRKSAKPEPSVHKDPLFDELDDDEIDNMDTEDAQDVGMTGNGVNAEKEGVEDAVSTEDVVEKGTDKDKDSTVSLDEGTDDRTEARSATPITSTTTPTMFGDDESIAQIDTKDKGKKKIEEEDESHTEYEDIPEAEKKFKL
ncbi:ribonuclease H-like domain-containing protein [Tanacetum coccineum]